MKRWWTAVGALLFCAAFLIGMGIGQILVQYQQSLYHIPSVLEIEGAGEVLSETLNNLSIEKELYAEKNGRCEARIQNDQANTSSVRVRLVRRATGEVLYQSGLIDPGFYVQYIDLQMRLEEGFYPCNIVWEFYDPQTQQSNGKAFQNGVLIIH